MTIAVKPQMKTCHPGSLWQNYSECQYLYFKQIKRLNPFEKLQSVTGNVIAAYRWFGWAVNLFTDVTPWQWGQNLAKDCWKNLRDSDARIFLIPPFSATTNISHSCLMWLPTTGCKAADTHSLLEHLCCSKMFCPQPTSICLPSLLLYL